MSVATVSLPTARPAEGRRPWHALAPLAALPVLLWAYGPTFANLAGRWAHESRYSHGFVVPGLALLVWWVRRRAHPVAEYRPSWWGLAPVAAGAALRLVGGYFYLDWFDGLSLLPVLAGLALLVGGRPLLAQTGPAVAVLVFMLPLPFQAEGALSAPLQRLGTVVSTFALQTLGLPAVSEGNVIHVDDLDIGVLEACNGLGMLSAFFAICTTAALVVRRPLPDRAAVLVSAVPLGVLINLARVTATGLVYAAVSAPAAQAFFHDLSGWLMMPLALAAVALELSLLRRLFPAGQ